ncbi:serine/arginine repetitive matrix protein 1-like [Schistocerca gregaria]|uniref:serine/arginine repetitive matrix protein 1-like n=1 Tax=Schistocerca gregaria TaxID=7010 RepID=UPI00211DF125|nr:serine/arginine repetitive matrix protein 1-like [Schistocerca gregaria]
MCREEWANESHRYAYTITLLTLQYIFPVICLLVTYTMIVYMVWNRAQPGEEYHLREVRALNARRKVIVMMIAVVTAFMICWLPLNVLLLVVEHQPAIEQWAGLPYLYLFCHWFAMSHACCNPIIYSWLNARFRAGFCLGLSKMPVIGKWIPHHTILDAADLVAGRSRRPSLRPDLAAQQRPFANRASRPTSLSTATTTWSADSPLATDATFRFPETQQPAPALRRSRSVASSSRPRTRNSTEQPLTDLDIGAVLTPPSRPLLTRQSSVPPQRALCQYQDIEEEATDVVQENGGRIWPIGNNPSSSRHSRSFRRRTTSAPLVEPTVHNQTMQRRRQAESPSPSSSNEMDIEDVTEVAEADQHWMFARVYGPSTSRGSGHVSRRATSAPSVETTIEMQNMHRSRRDAESSSPQARSFVTRQTAQQGSINGSVTTSPHRRMSRRLTASARDEQLRRHAQDLAPLARSSSGSRSPSPRPARVSLRKYKSVRNAQQRGGDEASVTLQVESSSDSESPVVRFIRRIACREETEAGMETRRGPEAESLPPPPPPPPRTNSIGLPAVCFDLQRPAPANDFQGHLEHALRTVA